MERFAQRHGSAVALVVAVAGLLALVLLLAPAAVGPEAALARYAGSGGTTTPDQQLVAGWYAVRWNARAGDQPEQGCLLGMRLEQRRSDALPEPEERYRGGLRGGNLVYQTLPRNTALSGSSGPMALEAGVYGFVVDGWCAWDISLSALPNQALPSGIGGPRM